jgi:hypothetical protein
MLTDLPQDYTVEGKDDGNDEHIANANDMLDAPTAIYMESRQATALTVAGFLPDVSPDAAIMASPSYATDREPLDSWFDRDTKSPDPPAANAYRAIPTTEKITSLTLDKIYKKVQPINPKPSDAVYTHHTADVERRYRHHEPLSVEALGDTHRTIAARAFTDHSNSASDKSALQFFVPHSNQRRRFWILEHEHDSKAHAEEAVHFPSLPSILPSQSTRVMTPVNRKRIIKSGPGLHH